MERRGGREMNGLCLREGVEAYACVLYCSVEIAVGDWRRGAVDRSDGDGQWPALWRAMTRGGWQRRVFQMGRELIGAETEPACEGAVGSSLVNSATWRACLGTVGD